MIPTVLVLGFVAGLLFYRQAWWFVPVAAVAWAVVTWSASGAALGALNAIVGVAAAVAMRWLSTRAGRTIT